MEDFYDISSILAEDERVFVSVRTGVLHIDLIIGNEEGNHLREDQRLELPIWLAKVLRSKNYLDVKIPIYLKKKQITSILADPVRSDLRPYFYEAASYMATASREDQRLTLIPALVNILCDRMLNIMTHAENSGHDDLSAFQEKLTVWEGKFFSKSFEFASDTQKWKQRSFERLESYIEAKKRRRLSNYSA